jgi:hypothetical protein
MAPKVDLLQGQQIMNEMNGSLAANANVVLFC